MTNLVRVPVIAGKNGSLDNAEEVVAVENEIIVRWDNGTIISKTTGSPGLEQELAVGLLATMGVSVLSHGVTVEHQSDRTIVTVERSTARDIIKKEADMTIGLSQITEGLALLRSKQDLLKKTGCAHGGLLMEIDTRAHVFAEDIRRHNALSKVVGLALTRDVSISRAALFFTGRLTSEIVERAGRAGIHIICSMAVATEAAIQGARDAKMTLVGSGPDNLWIYNMGTITIVP